MRGQRNGQHAIQSIEIQRLRVALVASGSQCSISPDRITQVRAHGHDRDQSCLTVLPNAPGGSEAIHDRHAEVHQDEVGVFFQGTLHSLFAVFRFQDSVALHLQKQPHQVPCIFDVVGHENNHDQPLQLWGLTRKYPCKLDVRSEGYVIMKARTASARPRSSSIGSAPS